MNLFAFLADHVFRFRYRDPVTNDGNDGGPIVWDIGIYEDEMDKMHIDFFFMGFVIGALLTAFAAGIIWLIVP